MNYTKQTYLVAFALFSLFFGAGNLILPPFLGYNAGSSWMWVATGFALSGVVIPILAIYGYARIQGTLLDFAKKVSPKFALLYAIIVYCICVSLPSPRTASVAYQIAIEPYFDISSLWVSILYFTLVLLFALNRTRILSLIGNFLTPLIILILILIISLGFCVDTTPMRDTIFENTFTTGILEGYQTFDALGGVVVGTGGSWRREFGYVLRCVGLVRRRSGSVLGFDSDQRREDQAQRRIHRHVCSGVCLLHGTVRRELFVHGHVARLCGTSEAACVCKPFPAGNSTYPALDVFSRSSRLQQVT